MFCPLLQFFRFSTHKCIFRILVGATVAGGTTAVAAGAASVPFAMGFIRCSCWDPVSYWKCGCWIVVCCPAEHCCDNFYRNCTSSSDSRWCCSRDGNIWRSVAQALEEEEREERQCPSKYTGQTYRPLIQRMKR